MPQARRKTPFSGKAKKQQLQNKKQNRVLLMPTSTSSEAYDMVSVNYQPNKSRGRESNRYALKFYRESDGELAAKKEHALKALEPVPEKDLEVNPNDYFPPDLSFPKRPPWDFNMTPAQLDAQEQRYFKNYIDSLQKSEHWKDMSYFELNLETWRQLWRVMEMCDILLLIVDVRYAGMMFPPSLYEYIVNEQKKDMILVLNKIDLAPPSVVAAWKQHFNTNCPALKVVYFTSCPGYNLRGATSDKAVVTKLDLAPPSVVAACKQHFNTNCPALKVVYFTSCPGYNSRVATSDKAGLQVRRRKGRLRMCVEGATQIFSACKDIVKGAVDLTSWEEKIKEEMNIEREDDEVEIGETILQVPDTTYHSHERYKDGVLTIGCCGHPNVGKSSLMNAVLGHKRLSVSRTPGHTKHFQTIYTTPQVRFCDCPGLVFPSKVPRPVQILMGSYPIAQLREPYTTIRYLSERIDLPKLLRIEHPENDDTWSPRDICDGWAKKRGYLTAKAARLDTYRAANSLLRMALDGKISLCLRPPGYTEQKAKFENCEEVKYVKWVQALTNESDEPEILSEIESDDEQTKSDSVEDESSDDEEQTAAIANKFAALANDD